MLTSWSPRPAEHSPFFVGSTRSPRGPFIGSITSSSCLDGSWGLCPRFSALIGSSESSSERQLYIGSPIPPMIKVMGFLGGSREGFEFEVWGLLIGNVGLDEMLVVFDGETLHLQGAAPFIPLSNDVLKLSNYQQQIFVVMYLFGRGSLFWMLLSHQLPPLSCPRCLC